MDRQAGRQAGRLAGRQPGGRAGGWMDGYIRTYIHTYNLSSKRYMNSTCLISFYNVRYVRIT